MWADLPSLEPVWCLVCCINLAGPRCPFVGLKGAVRVVSGCDCHGNQWTLSKAGEPSPGGGLLQPGEGLRSREVCPGACNTDARQGSRPAGLLCRVQSSRHALHQPLGV